MFKLTAIIVVLILAQAAFVRSSYAVKPECESAMQVQLPDWSGYLQKLEGKTRKGENPFAYAGVDADLIGEVHKRFRKIAPVYGQLLKVIGQPSFTQKEYETLAQSATHLIEQALDSKLSDPDALFAAQEVIRLMAVVEARTEFESPEGQQDGAQGKPGKDQKKKKEAKEQEPSWSPSSDRYDPENKNLGAGSSKKEVHLLKTTVSSNNRLLRRTIYDAVTLKDVQSKPVIRPGVDKNIKLVESDHMILKTLGQNQIDIPYNYGFEVIPGKYKGYDVVEVSRGQYRVNIRENLDEVRVPLAPARPEAFSSAQGPNYYLNKFNLPLETWPESVQTVVKSIQKSAMRARDKSALLAKFFQTDGDFLYYSVGNLLKEEDLAKIDALVAKLENKLPRPVAMAHGKAVNCDGAAWIGALLNIEYLGIPARFIGGRTISGRVQTNEGTVYSVSGSNSPGHAWIEIWDGEWIPLDYTPKKNSPQSGRSEGESEPKNEIKEDESDDSDQSSSGSSKSKDGDEKDVSQSSDKDGKKEKEQSGKNEKDRAGKQSEREITDDSQLPDGLEQNKKSSKPQSLLSIVSDVINEAFIQRLLMESSREGLKKEFSDYSTQVMQHGARNDAVDSFMLSSLQQVSEAKDLDLISWIGEVRLMISRADLYGAWSQLRMIQSLVEKISELRALTSEESRFLSAIKSVMLQFQQIKDPNAASYDLVKRVYDALPGPVSRRWVTDTYGDDVLTLGSQSQKKFAHDLQTKKLEALIRMSLLSDYTNMVLNSDRVPSYKWGPSIHRSAVPTRRQDVVLARSPLEIQKMIFQLLPGQHIFEPLFQGKQFAVGSRELKKVVDRQLPLEKKFTLALYDISGSMEGDKIAFQDTMLMNFADHAASETDALGRQIHEVMAAPFGDKVYPKRAAWIRSFADAKAFIDSKIARTTKATDGTDIELAILYFLDLVAKAHEPGSPNTIKRFQRANLILYTDGGANVDMEKIKTAMKRIPDGVKIFINFVAIGGTNQDLVDLAASSNLASARPMVWEISNGEINKVVDQAQNMKKNPEAFASNLKMDEIPQSLLNSVSQLSELHADFRTQTDEKELFQKFRELAAGQVDLDNLPNLFARPQLEAFVKWVIQTNLPKGMRREIALRALETYPSISGRPLSRLMVTELDQFKLLKKWVEDGR